jgi:hypothetical protein
MNKEVKRVVRGRDSRLGQSMRGDHHERMPSNGRLTFIGRTTFRNAQRLFGIKQADRRHHLYVIGKTGTGKSTLLETLISQDLAHRRGLALLDPHGDLVERVRARVPEEQRDQVIYFDVPNVAQALAFNPLERVPALKRPLAAAGVLEAFKKLWADSWGPRLEHLLRNALLALFDQPEATLADILRLLDDEVFRRDAARRVANAQVRHFWLREYEHYPARFRAEAIAPIQNKVGAFLADPRLHRILTQPRSAFDLRRVMDDGRILLVNLAKGKLGEDSSALLGALLVSKIGGAALARADQPEEERRDFYVYLDEFQNVTTLSLATMLSELRKYRVGLLLAHQYLAQLDPAVRDAVLGNVGTLLAFRVGPADAEILVQEFSPEFMAEDLVRLPNYHIVVKLMVDGAPVGPFSAQTLGPTA